jgi:ABC-type sugar transport system substrate-binding protein
MKKLLAFILVISMVFTLSACGGTKDKEAADGTQPTQKAQPTEGAAQTEGEPAAEGDQFFIGYAAAGLSSEYQMMIYDELTAACAEANVRLETLSCEGDVSLQVQQIENFITMGVDSIITYPVDSSSMAYVLKKARDAGIYVVVNDATELDVDSCDLKIVADGFEMGDVAAQAAADWIDATFPDAAPGTVECAVLGFWYTEQMGIRCDVMKDIASYTDKAVLVETYDIGVDNYATAVGQYVDILLQQHPDVRCILSFTDTFAILADEVIMQKDNLDFSKIGQFTVDRTSEGFSRIKLSQTNGSTIRGTAVPGMYVAKEMLEAALGNRKDQIGEDKKLLVETFPVTADNIDDYLE